MTNQNLTALILRIAGIYLFTKIFDHFGSYFFSVYGAATMARFDEFFNEPIDKFYVNGTFLIIANIVISTFLFVKAEWISKKLIHSDKDIVTELNPKSLSKVILLTVGIIWLAKLIYLIPDFIDFCVKFITIINGNDDIELPEFEIMSYMLKLILTLLLIFRINSIANWIVKKI